MTLQPGMQLTYEGETDQGGKLVPHRLIVTVTDLTKMSAGVRSVVSWDQDFAAGELAEAELAFFAQDNDGNVWNMGEYPEEYEGGKFVLAPSWMPGFEDARAGIAMQASPQLETPSYSQGWGPAVHWTDRGQVHQTGQKVCVPFKCYEDVLVISESSAAEPNAFQLKYFAPGVGNIRVDWMGKDVTQEKLELVKVVQLSAEELAEARDEALKLEKHAYEIGNTAYAKTPPSELPPDAKQPAITSSAAVSNVVPQDLLTIEAQVEDIMDVVPSGAWANADKDIAAIDAGWINYQKQVSKDGAPQALQDAFGQTLGRLKAAAKDNNASTTMQSANDLSAIVVDLYDVYHPAVPTDLGRLDVLERQVILDVDGKDFAAAAKTLATINTTWERVKPFMMAHKGAEVATRYEKSLATQASVLKAQDGNGLKDEAKNALEIVDALEIAAAQPA